MPDGSGVDVGDPSAKLASTGAGFDANGFHLLAVVQPVTLADSAATPKNFHAYVFVWLTVPPLLLATRSVHFAGFGLTVKDRKAAVATTARTSVFRDTTSGR